MKKILVACGSGMLTSVLAGEKLEAKLRGRGYWSGGIVIDTGKVADIRQKILADTYDLVITTAPLGFEIPVRTMTGVPFLTGKGIQAAVEEVIVYLGLEKMGEP